MRKNTVLPKLSLAVLAALLSTGFAHAGTITGTINTSSGFSPTNQSTDGVTYYSAPADSIFTTVVIGEFDFTAPGNNTISGASLSGNFGSNALASGTAPVNLFLNNVAVAVCDSSCEAASNNADVSWSYVFNAAQLASLASGHAVLTALETGPSQIVLDPTSITVQVAPVPEPDSILMLGVGLALIGALTRRKSPKTRI